MRTAMKVGGCVLIPIVLLVVGLIGVGAYWWVFRGGADMAGISTTAETFVRSAQAGNWDEAHGQMSSTLQQEVSAEALRVAWERTIAADGELQPVLTIGSGADEQRTYLLIDSSTLVVAESDGVQTATLPTSLTFATGATKDVTLRFVKEGDAWRLAELPPFLTQQ